MTALNLDTYSLSLITAKEDILSARSSTDWAVFTYEKKWSLKLLDSGVGGLEELTKKFNKNLIQYGLCQVNDPNTGVQRVILIHWIGENVDAFQREVTAQHLPSIRKFFKEANVLLGAQKVEDITQELVAQALNRVPPPSRAFQKARIPGSHEVVGTKYMKTNPAVEMKISKREAFWQRSEREEERRKEMERLRQQEERIVLEKERIQRERLEEEDRERRIQEKERLVEEQRKEQARLEAERRRREKERWVQQQKEYDEELKGRFKRSQSIEMAAEAAALLSGRSLHPRDFFRQQERSVSSSSSPPSTPSSPSKSSSGFFNRTTLRYQRSVTESILTPTSRSPTFFQGFQKRDSFSSFSPGTPQPCSPAFIFSKSPLPTTSPKVDSLPSFIPPPITTARITPTQVKGSPPPHTLHTSPRTGSCDPPFRAEYVTVSPAEHGAVAPDTNAEARSLNEDLHSGEKPARSGGLYRAELVPVDSPATSHSEVQELPTKAAKSPTSFKADKPTAIKATVSVSSSMTEIAVTSPTPTPEAKIPTAPQSSEPIPPSALKDTQKATAEVPTPILADQVFLPTQEITNKTSDIKFHSEEPVLPTDSALYEPKISHGSTSLVSLLAPIPYTPYRAQRADSTTLRSPHTATSVSDNALLPSLETLPILTLPRLEASPSSAAGCKYPSTYAFSQDSSTKTSPVPAPMQPLNGSTPKYQSSMPPPTEPLSVFSPITSEISLTDPVPKSASFPVYISATSQPSSDQVNVPESLVGSLQSSSESQPKDIQTSIPLPQSLPESSGILTQNSPESEPNNDQAEMSSPTRTSDTQPHTDISDNLVPQSTPVSPPITTEHLADLQPYNVHADIPPIAPSSGFLDLGTKSSSKSQPSNNKGDVSLPEPPPTPSFLTESLAESKVGNFQNDILIPESSSSSSTIPTEISVGLQLNPMQMDVLIPQSVSMSSSLPPESSDGPLLNTIQSDNSLIEPLHEPPTITTEITSAPQVNVQADISLVELSPSSFTTEHSNNPQSVTTQAESLCEPPFIITEVSSAPQLNVQEDISLVKPSPSFLTSDSSTEPQSITIQVESLPEPPPITTDVCVEPQINNNQVDIPFTEPSSLSLTSESSTQPQFNNTQADIPLVEPSYEPPSSTTTLSNIQADNPLTEPLSGSSSHLPESSIEPKSVNIQAESLPEPLSITINGFSGPQLNKVQVDISLNEPSSVSSSLPTESSSRLQSNTIRAESLLESSSLTESSFGRQINNTQSNNPLLDSSVVSPCLPIESSAESQINNNQDVLLLHSSSTCASHESPGTVNNAQADIQLLESSPVLFISTENATEPQPENNRPITVPQESSVSPSLQTTSIFDLQPNNTLTDIPQTTSIPPSSSLSTEGSSESQPNNFQTDIVEFQPNNVQTDIVLADLLLISSSLPTEFSSESQPNVQTDIVLADLLLVSSSLPTERSFESQPNNVQTDNVMAEILPVSSSLPIEEGSYESQLLPVSSSLPTEGSFESQPNNAQTDILLAGLLPVSSLLHTEGSSESQPNNVQTDIVLAELLHVPSSLPTDCSSESQAYDIQSEIKLEGLPIPSSILTESPAESLVNDIQPDIVSGKSSPALTESSTESPLVNTDIPVLELSPTSSLDTTVYSPEPQSSSDRNDAQSPESMAASTVPLTESSPESKANGIQFDNLVQEAASVIFSIPTNVSSEEQLNNLEADIPLQEPPPATPTELLTNNVHTDLSLVASSFIKESSSIPSENSTGLLPQVQEDIPLIVSSPMSSPPSCENTPDSEPSNNNESGTQLFSIPTSSSEEPLPIIEQTEVPLSESTPVSICPHDNTSGYDGKPIRNQSEFPSDEISPVHMVLLEEVLPNQSPAPCLPSDNTPEPPLGRSSPSFETMYAEKVILVEDTHPGSPPVNGNLIALESVTTINPGDLVVKETGNVENVSVYDVLFSNNITVDEDAARDPKLTASCEQLLHKQLNNNASEALL
ncbi:flocculation protein FLO11-like [Bufo bufo]|uniref:flocculation protein FLO11-like n=1 Tax=Bufo bufo TaxID=8384 RepID=UPI001ABE279F|nr:flocculation protein FLO11-like [Bufo bufo]